MKERKKRTPNYKYVVAGNKVICISRYAGKTVKGIAKCSPTDEFDEEAGKELAKLRCDFKVAELRYKRATSEFMLADYYYQQAEAYFDHCYDYVERADEELSETAQALANFQEVLK